VRGISLTQVNAQFATNTMENSHEQGTDKRSGGSRDKWRKSKDSVRQALGKTEELLDNVYKVGTNDQAEMYVTTTKEIAEYVGMKFGWELRTLVKFSKEATFTKPTYPSEKPAVITRAEKAEVSTKESSQMAEYKVELGIYHEDLNKYKDSKGKVFVIILGQCTREVINWLEQGRGLDKLEEDRDVVGLLKLLKEMAFSDGGDRDPFLNVTMSLRKLAMIQQGTKEPTAKYYQRLRTAADVLIGHWGDFFPSKLIDQHITKEEAGDRLLARIFLAGSDKGRFGSLQEELNNAYVGGTDRYPKTLEETQRLLCKYQGPRKPSKLDGNDDRRGRSFAQTGKQGSPGRNASSRGNSPESATGEHPNKKKTDKKAGSKNRKRSGSPVSWTVSD
jgi:hypothetical protein